MSSILDKVKFNADGLVPAITQDIRTDEVLMLAYMNEESLRRTVETGLAHYYSRSRQKLWLKGETSGHFQKVRSISVDCDGDTLLLKVDQTGAACHTGHRSCFFTRLEAVLLKDETERDGTSEESAEQPASAEWYARIQKDVCGQEPVHDALQAAEKPGAEVLQEVFEVISDRLVHPREGSYTNYLFGKGLDKILKKVGEEACEVVIASKNRDSGEIKAEIADLLYHLMVLLVERGLTLQDVYEELQHRK